jgi:hypothetical protein
VGLTLNSKLAGLRVAAVIAIACTSSAALADAPFQVVTLTWVAPTENTDGSTLTDLQGYYIYMGDAPDSMVPAFYTDASRSSFVLGYNGTNAEYFGVSAVNLDGVESMMTGPVASTPH